MSPIIFFPGFWRPRSRTEASAPAAKYAAPPSAAILHVAPVGPRAIAGGRERPVLRRTRRHRQDSVLGLRWLA
jgi:hypothetical protein